MVCIPKAQTYVSSVQFCLPYTVAWSQLSNPLNFPLLYPHWVQRMEPSGSAYKGVAPSDASFTVVPHLNEDFGIIDFEIIDDIGQVELSRSRLFPLKSGGCFLVHLAVRWDGVDEAYWQEHQAATDADLENAKQILEADWLITNL